MKKGLILDPRYNDVGRCDCCQSDNVGRKLLTTGAPNKRDRMLCYVCAATFISTDQQYYKPHFDITINIAMVANIILKEIKGVPQDEDSMRHKCWWLCRVWCFAGLHRWDSPGGECECCGYHDDFFDPHGGGPRAA